MMWETWGFPFHDAIRNPGKELDGVSPTLCQQQRMGHSQLSWIYFRPKGGPPALALTVGVAKEMGEYDHHNGNNG